MWLYDRNKGSWRLVEFKAEFRLKYYFVTCMDNFFLMEDFQNGICRNPTKLYFVFEERQFVRLRIGFNELIYGRNSATSNSRNRYRNSCNLTAPSVIKPCQNPTNMFFDGLLSNPSNMPAIWNLWKLDIFQEILNYAFKLDWES